MKTNSTWYLIIFFVNNSLSVAESEEPQIISYLGFLLPAVPGTIVPNHVQH